MASLTKTLNTDYLRMGTMDYGEALIANLRFALLEQKRAQALRESRGT